MARLITKGARQCYLNNAFVSKGTITLGEAVSHTKPMTLTGGDYILISYEFYELVELGVVFPKWLLEYLWEISISHVDSHYEGARERSRDMCNYALEHI